MYLFNKVHYCWDYKHVKVRSEQLSYDIKVDRLSDGRKIHIIQNAFTPEVYIRAIGLNPRLELIETFYIDDLGERQITRTANTKLAAAIIRKKI